MPSAEPAPVRPTVPVWCWWIVFMLFLATVVNYMDRQTLTSVSPYILEEFKLNLEEYGEIESYFFISYAVFMVVAGVMADRANLRWLFSGALVVWSAAGFACGAVRSLGGLKVCRAVLGMGEAFNWPCAVGVIQRILPREARSLGNGLFNSGMTLGAVATPLLVQATVGRNHGQGWRMLFMVVGAAGSLWVVLWLLSTRGERAAALTRPAQDPSGPSERRPFLEVFLMPRFWITAAVGIAVNITWHFFRVWMPFILTRKLGIPKDDFQNYLAGYFLVADVGSILAGFAVAKLTRKASVERARLIVLFAAALLCMSATPILWIQERTLMVPAIFLVGAGSMGVFAIFYSLIQDISPHHSSKCLGLIGSSVWFINSGLLKLEGRLADAGHFGPMVAIAGAIPMAAAFTLLYWPAIASAKPATA